MDVLNPTQIETAIRDVANRMAEGVQICSDRYAAFLDADHRFDVAYARAYMQHEGPAHEKKYAAVLATRGERDARDAADVAYRHADRRAKALESELRSLQSVGASLRVQYSVAGRGEQ
ncbi:hypothetical protein M3G04_02535 [Dietzia cinnamea]|uniref:hypothetical protein n=1 Tax=Dietzia cinnamea TaxID=321318 RepID=UPI00223A75D7|nr:hypothetical protein [Dietzia cinnamea]MCT2299788.1 hypothetical protein [Dietzia cinnamea]